MSVTKRRPSGDLAMKRTRRSFSAAMVRVGVGGRFREKWRPAGGGVGGGGGGGGGRRGGGGGGGWGGGRGGGRGGTAWGNDKGGGKRPQSGGSEESVSKAGGLNAERRTQSGKSERGGDSQFVLGVLRSAFNPWWVGGGKPPQSGGGSKL